jgi:hypothetical protein
MLIDREGGTYEIVIDRVDNYGTSYFEAAREVNTGNLEMYLMAEDKRSFIVDLASWWSILNVIDWSTDAAIQTPEDYDPYTNAAGNVSLTVDKVCAEALAVVLAVQWKAHGWGVTKDNACEALTTFLDLSGIKEKFGEAGAYDVADTAMGMLRPDAALAIYIDSNTEHGAALSIKCTLTNNSAVSGGTQAMIDPRDYVYGTGAKHNIDAAVALAIENGEEVVLPIDLIEAAGNAASEGQASLTNHAGQDERDKAMDIPRNATARRLEASSAEIGAAKLVEWAEAYLRLVVHRDFDGYVARASADCSTHIKRARKALRGAGTNADAVRTMVLVDSFYADTYGTLAGASDFRALDRGDFSSYCDRKAASLARYANRASTVAGGAHAVALTMASEVYIKNNPEGCTYILGGETADSFEYVK